MVHIPLRLRIDGDALVANWRWLAARSGTVCGAAIKADGYGLGARAAVKRLAGAGCRDFFVATWFEAEALMPWDDGLTLYVLHGVGPDDLAGALSSPARPVLNTPRQVARWRDAAPDRGCDIMVDTGMNRLGLTPSELGDMTAAGARIELLLSHLACADEPGHPLNGRQLAEFGRLRGEVAAARYSLANSAGICLGPDYGFDLARPGLALYGGRPMPGDDDQAGGLRQVVTPEAQLIQVRDVPAGASVGYGATYVAPADRRVGILNLGYADGYLRALGPSGHARRGERSLPLLGRVSMDLIAVDLSDAAEVGEGDWLAIDYRLPELAAASGLSQYELLTGLGDRFERIWT